MAIYIKMCIYKAKICVLNKLHVKMFITWSRLHIFICRMILFVVQMQTSMSKVFILLFKRLSLCRRDCLCCDEQLSIQLSNRTYTVTVQQEECYTFINYCHCIVVQLFEYWELFCHVLQTMRSKLTAEAMESEMRSL
jgi:hypothetical protein